MKNQPKNNSSAPVIIIGLVLLVALGGGWWLYKSSTAPKPKTNTNSSTNKTTAEIPPRTTNAPGAQPPNMLGSPTATVTVEEFADFQCSACAAKHPLAKEIISTYGTRIKFIFRNYPLNIPAHDKAYDAAVAAEAAGMQNKFWDMQHQLFSNQQSWSSASDFRKILEEYAQKIGLDVEKFKNDMAGLVAKGRVNADLERGRGMGISSTPTFFINGRPVTAEQMDSVSMRALIDAELAKAQSSQSQPTPPSGAVNTNK